MPKAADEYKARHLEAWDGGVFGRGVGGGRTQNE